jgi:CTP synthase
MTLKDNNICTYGQIFKELIEEQERGDYLGKTITNNPFVTNKILKRLKDLSNADVVVNEVGGTVDDAESSIFLNAICQLKENNKNDCVIILVSPILWLETVKEYKTKPLQRSIRDLQSYGIIPHILICRSVKPVPNEILDKIATHTNIKRDCILTGVDCSTIYEVPLKMYEQGLDDIIVDRLRLGRSACRIHKYRELVEKYIDNCLDEINVGIVGKYENVDAYLSIKEALTHAGITNNVKINISWIQADDIEKHKDQRGVYKHFEGLHAIIIAPGFDKRGIEGKIKAVQYVREKKIPFLGICLGLQCAVIEFARNVCNLSDANSLEFDKNAKNPVVNFVEGQENLTKKSATMRLGSYDCELAKDSLALSLYSEKLIKERHRHRYEINNSYAEQFASKGFKVSGRHPSGLIEIMEMDRNIHPFFIGTQAHPEFKSRLTEPAPLFFGLIQAAIAYKKENCQLS